MGVLPKQLCLPVVRPQRVMGLRTGFIQAGAQNLLMTLWPINREGVPFSTSYCTQMKLNFIRLDYVAF
jgi:hypothetical protein